MPPETFHDRYRILVGDALALLRDVPDQSIDALICDPPYSSGGRTTGERAKRPLDKYRTTQTKIVRPDFDGDNKDQRAYRYWSALWLGECLRAAKPGAPALVFTDWRQLAVTIDAFQAGGWLWRGIVAWDKTEGARPTMGRFTSQCEFIVWGSKGPMPYDRGVGTLPGAYRIPVRQSDKHHLTGKPTALLRELVKITPPGGHILDPFCGSGTTGEAALGHGCTFTGIELSPEYAQISRERLAAAVFAEA